MRSRPSRLSSAQRSDGTVASAIRRLARICSRLCPPGITDTTLGCISGKWKAASINEVPCERHTDSIRRAIEAGVTIAMGTDSGVGPHGQNLRELALMVDAGMTPMQALISATKTASELLSVEDERGTIEAGKLADLVVVDGDPLDVTNLQENITAVYKGGRLVSGSA